MRKIDPRILGGAALILASVYAVEGGYVNDKDDPGGETNHGITIKEARSAGYTGRMIDLKRHCTSDEEICADKLYIDRYIMAPGFGPMVILAPAVAEELVDTGVNMGPARPSRWFQQALNQMGGARLRVDGKVGHATIAAYIEFQRTAGAPNACRLMLDTLDARQEAEYHRLIRVNPRLKKYRRGWLNHRIGNVDRARCTP